MDESLDPVASQLLTRGRREETDFESYKEKEKKTDSQCEIEK